MGHWHEILGPFWMAVILGAVLLLALAIMAFLFWGQR